MNETERHLTKELDRAASAVQVDVDQLWEAMQDRTSAPVPAHPACWRRRVAPYVAAASVLAVFAVVAALLANGNHSPKPATTPHASIGDWACKDRMSIVPGVDPTTGERVRAVLNPDVRPPEAEVYGVPRYEFTFTGNTGVLDYGDDSGRRIARTDLTRTPTGWLVGQRTLCSGPDRRLSPDPSELGQHTASPLPLDPRSAQVKATPPIGTPIMLDDRMYYDAVGMLRHRTLYVFAVQGGYQFASMPADGSYSSGAQAEDTVGANLSPINGSDDTYIFGDHDARLGLVLTYLTKKTSVEGITSYDVPTNTAGASQHFSFPGGRTLYTVVPAPAEDGRTLVTVHRSTGDDPPRRY
ncbi:hypothetical protein AB0L70_10405 [Kribbella sp. NPDC051952]|uniref:hypothetical protein n=1 Tax=Kribbella sp. NPDC051952 TaxID=3154851 RepID=UPI0034320E71